MYCKKCGSSVSANAVRCPVCGAPTVSVQPNDYTAQYDPRDLADNRVFAALSYLGILILVPIFGARHSYFARFHANQGLVFLLCSIAYSVAVRILRNLLNIIFGGFLSVVPAVFSLVTAVFSLFFLVLLILGIVNAATGRARELPVIGRFRLLR